MNDASCPAVGHEVFLRNLSALWQADPELALRIDAVNDDERVTLEATRSGDWTAKMATPAGRDVHLHSRYDPIADARRFADAVELEDKYCVVVLGFGLGYHIRALLDRLRGDAFIVCSEPSIPLLSTALTVVDLADALSSSRLVILCDDDKTRLHDHLNRRNALVMLGAQFVHHPPSMQVAEAAHNGVCKLMAEFVTFARMSLQTLVANSMLTCRNIAMNLATYVTTPPIDLLCERFSGNPGIVISAGPSLSRNIDLLAEAKGKAVLLAVQTTLEPLMQRGIVPDFVTSLDFHEMSQKFFAGVEGLEHVHLVAEPKATWHVLDAYPGPISILHNDWAQMLLGPRLAARRGLKPGATVAHLAFYLAVHMGCDPIIFVGQDLAFTGHVFYVPGVEIHRTWRSEINRFNTMEMKEWERIVRRRSILHRVAGLDGTELYTDELLVTYLEQFEKDIARVPQRVINATEGGARIRGTTSCSLREALGTYCTKAIDPNRFAYLRSTRWRDPGALPLAQAELDDRIAELDEMDEVCTEMLLLLGELEGLTDQPDLFNRRLIRVDELRFKVQSSGRVYGIVNAATQMAEFRRYSADRRISAADHAEPAERAKQQIRRDIEFVTGMQRGTAEVRPMLIDARDRLTKRSDKR